MITAMDPKTNVAMALYRAAEHLKTGSRNYNDYKASQLLEAKADLLVAEARIESWSVDLGFTGCEGDTACTSNQENS